MRLLTLSGQSLRRKSTRESRKRHPFGRGGRARKLCVEGLESRTLLAVTLTWSGPASALSLTEGTPGATPAITIQEPTPGVNVLEISLSTGYCFAAGSTTAATGLTYQNVGSPTTSEYATIDISSAGNVSSLVATLPGDYLTLGQIRDVAGGIGSITASAGTIEVPGISTASVNGNVNLAATGNLTVDASATIQTGTGTICLAADVNANGTGNDGVGTLSIGAGAVVSSTNSTASAITLRGANVNIDTSANPAVVGAQRSLSTTPTTTLAGGLDDPVAVAFDASGNLYVANQSGYTVSKFAPGATTPTATLTGLLMPWGMAFDGSGNLYVGNSAAQNNNSTISKFAPGATTPTTTLTGADGVSALAFDSSGKLYAANYYNGTVSEFAAGATTPTATLSGLKDPDALALDGSGNLFVANMGGVNTVSEFAPGAATPTATLAVTSAPLALAIGPNGNLYVATDAPGAAVFEFAPGATTPTATLSGLHYPDALDFDASGNLFVGNSTSGTVNEFTPGATTPSATLSGLSFPFALAFDPGGNLYVANESANTVSKFALSTTPTVGGVVIRSSLPTRPMSIGGTNNAVNGINLTDAELAQIYTTAAGTVTFGDSTQTGNITFKTVTVATTARAGTVVVQATGGPGQIILNDQGTDSPALNGNGGTIQLTPGTGGVQVIQSSSAANDVAIVSKGFTSPAAPLSLSLTFTPALGAQITLVSNTATPAASHPISGAFSNLAAGGTISATYDGIAYIFAANYGGGDGNDLVLTDVGQATTTTTNVSASRTSVVYGTPVTFTATVSAQGGSTAPTAGSVDFYDTTTGTDLGLGSFVTSTSTISTWTLATGVKTFNVTTGDTITATYTPGTGFIGSSGTTTQAVTAIPITASGITAANKTYNGNTTATLQGLAAASLAGVLSGDAVTLQTSGAAGAFASENVGQNITVSVTGLTLGGTQAGDYTLTQPTTTANITAAMLTVTGITAANKTYNGNTTAALQGLSTASLVGVVSGDTVTLGTSGAAGTFASESVGNNITVSVTGLTIGGAQASDYTLTHPATTANITPAALTVTGITAANKTYNGTTTATLQGLATASLVGVVSGDTVTLGTSGAAGTFASESVGNNITVSMTGLTIGGSQANDYTLTQPTTTANITAATLTVTGITAANKTYNGNTTAALQGLAAASLVGVVSGDTVTLQTSGAAGTFASKDVGQNITVSVTGLTLGGSQANDYTLTQLATTASITAATLTVTGITAADKIYNGGSAAALQGLATASLVGVAGGDTVTLGTSGATGTFAAKDAGTGITVSVAGLTISGMAVTAGDYSLMQPTTTANITAATLTVTGITAADKTYDGTATATLEGLTTASLAGVASGDVVTLGTTGAAGMFASKDVGQNVTVSVSGLTLSGLQAGDYTLTQPTTTANITAMPLTVTATGVSKAYDGTTTATVVLSDNRVAGDNLIDSYMWANFSNPGPGPHIPVTVTGIAISGPDAGNYALQNTTASATAEVYQTVAVIDDSAGSPNWTTTGTWTNWTGQGYDGDVHQATPVTSTNPVATATWTFNGLIPNQYYKVETTWTKNANRATNAPYTISGGASTLTLPVTVNQQLVPAGVFDSTDNWTWQELGVYKSATTTGELVVTLSNYGANGNVIADAVRIEPVPSNGPSIMVQAGTGATNDPVVVPTISGSVQTTVSFGTVVAGAVARKTFTVFNGGSDELSYTLSSLPAGYTLYSGSGTANVPPAVPRRLSCRRLRRRWARTAAR
jgi:hypothetical protein